MLLVSIQSSAWLGTSHYRHQALPAAETCQDCLLLTALSVI